MTTEVSTSRTDRRAIRLGWTSITTVASSEDPSQQTVMWERIRNSWATGFASRLRPGVKISEMQRASVDGVEALYFQAPAPRHGVMWRQWVLVKNGHAFVIVSTLANNDTKLLADVESMVKSFRVIS